MTEFRVETMKMHCVNCQAHELATIQGVFKLKTGTWTAEEKVEFALALWEGGNVNLLDLSEEQEADLVRIIKEKLPTFLQTKD